MKDVRVDGQGRHRCWNCGGATFIEQRTTKSKVMVGVGSLLTKKKLKCTLCGEYNDTGSAKPWKGPDSKRAAKKFGTAALDAPPPAAPASETPVAAAPLSLADEIGKLAALRDSGALTDDEFAAQKARLLSTD